jgi:hypothetical protein
MAALDIEDVANVVQARWEDGSGNSLLMEMAIEELYDQIQDLKDLLDIPKEGL